MFPNCFHLVNHFFFLVFFILPNISRILCNFSLLNVEFCLLNHWILEAKAKSIIYIVLNNIRILFLVWLVNIRICIHKIYMILCEKSLDFIVSFTKLFIFCFVNFRVKLFISFGSNFIFCISFRLNWFLTRIDFDLNIIVVFVIPFSFYNRIIFITLKLDFS